MPRPPDLTAAYQQSLVRLSARLTALLTIAWSSVTEATQEGADQWLAAIVPLVLGAQMQSVSLSDAYLSAYLTAHLGRSVPTVGLDPASLVGVAARRGTAVERVYSRPLGMVALSVARGAAVADALRAEQWRVEQAAATDVQLTARAARVEWANASDEEIQGWQRVTGGASCALCASASGRIYRTDDLMPLHAGCNCVTEPVLDGVRQKARPDPEIDDSPALAQSAEDGESVARVVHDPELGPLLEAK